MNAFERFTSALWTLFASSSGFLLFGLFAAGVVHALAHRLERLQSRIPRGMKAIGFGIVAGLPLPICSCGIVPVALALRRRNSHPETAAAFLVSTPETSLDAVGLTAALLGVPFALLRVLAGLTAAVLAGTFVIATEAWPGGEELALSIDGEVPDHHPPPEWWPRLVHRVVALSKEWFGRAAKPAGEETAVPETRGPRIRKAVLLAMRVGFVDTLDEISWMLLIGFSLSALLLTFLPADFAARVPGGLLGQIIFGLAISLPLYICASGSVPLVAALIVKGLSPVAALAIFLIGPITNPAMLLMLRRSFGRRFVGSLLIAGVLAAAIFGSILAAMPGANAVTQSILGGDPAQSSLGGWDWLFAILFLPVFVLSLARAGWRRAAEDVRSTVASVIPADARAALRAVRGHVRPRRVLWASIAIAVVAWFVSGFAVIHEGTVGFAEVFGKAGPSALAPGLHWLPPSPIGRLRRVDAQAVVDVSVGFRPGQAATVYSSASGWHSVYTSAGSRPEESTYVTGDLNLVESKAGIHLLVSDPRAFAYRGGDPIESVRSLFQASLRELLASRSIDDTLTTARGSIERAARSNLQRRLDAAGIPLRTISVNVLDLHPPDAAVRAFRDISSAGEDRETRIHQASGKADAALPTARGQAATMLASAESDRIENVARAEGVSTAFAVQAQVARQSGPAVRSMLRWDALDRLFFGKRVLLLPHQTARDLMDLPASPAGGFF